MFPMNDSEYIKGVFLFTADEIFWRFEAKYIYLYMYIYSIYCQPNPDLLFIDLFLIFILSFIGYKLLLNYLIVKLPPC